MKPTSGNQKTVEEYSTTEFYLAVYLKHMGYHIQRVDGDPGRRVFVFRDGEDREDDLIDYFNGEIRVCPYEYTKTIREMKSLLYS
jgi:hypothetical protein